MRSLKIISNNGANKSNTTGGTDSPNELNKKHKRLEKLLSDFTDQWEPEEVDNVLMEHMIAFIGSAECDVLTNDDRRKHVQITRDLLQLMVELWYLNGKFRMKQLKKD